MPPIYLYIKKHALTGKMYFGKTQGQNPWKYKGSGKEWKSHIKTHGSDKVHTIWVSEPFKSRREVTEFAMLFSETFDIVNDSRWANMIPENGLPGTPKGTRTRK